jgi:hypothetical protein
MQVKRASMFKSIAFLAVLGFLVGVSGAGAADREQKPIQGFNKRPKVVNAGKHQGLSSFLKSLAGSECSSSCCWASANCPGGDVECSSTRCDAWCPGEDGGHAGYSCNAT